MRRFFSIFVLLLLFMGSTFANTVITKEDIKNDQEEMVSQIDAELLENLDLLLNWDLINNLDVLEELDALLNEDFDIKEEER